MSEPTTPNIVSRDEWERARAELLVREKAHTRAGDELAAARRRLPMTPMEPIMVAGPDGPVPLHDVFEARRMLIVYHFMWNKGAPHHRQCEGRTQSAAGRHRLNDDLPHPSDENEHDHDPRETPKAESCGCSQ